MKIAKKIAAVVLSILLLCICLSACSTTSDTVTTQSTTTTTTSTTVKSTEIASTSQDIKLEETSVISTTTTTKKIEKSTTKKEEKPTTKKVEKTTTKQSISTTKSTQKTTESDDLCYLTIECKSILDNVDNLAKGHEKYVPSNGIILSNYSYKIDGEVSVYDVLKQACNDKNIPINAQHTTYGVYVAGINNIDEKDCGRYSGWLYYVNGKKPSFTCGKYIVNAGDKITFKYTCTYE